MMVLWFFHRLWHNDKFTGKPVFGAIRWNFVYARHGRELMG